jgi:gliding motility-associated transport system ATP-binding protein
MAVLSLDGLSKRFGARLAVDAVSFDVKEREVFGLLGPNGSGKSTILRLVTGYLRPTAGSVRVAGIDVVRDGPAARRRRAHRFTGTCASPSSSLSWVGSAA